MKATKRLTTLSMTLVSLALSCAAPAQAVEFIPLGTLSGNTASYAYGVSDDGMVVAGRSLSGPSNDQAFRWTEDSGMIGLGTLTGYEHSRSGVAGQQMLSRDGSSVAGSLHDDDDVLTTIAFIHTEADGMIGISINQTNVGMRAVDISYDGSVVVGNIEYADPLNPFNYPREPFRWTEAGGTVPLGHLGGNNYTIAYDITDDGSLIVGKSRRVVRSPLDGEVIESTDYEIFKWTEADGMLGTGVFKDSRVATNTAVTLTSNDGSVISSTDYISSQTSYEAFYWSEQAGKVGLGWLPRQAGEVSDLFSAARDMTPDGRLIAGWSGEGGSTTPRPFVWSEERGMEDFQQILIEDHGLGIALDQWNLTSIQGMSSNGQFFTGFGVNPSGVFEGWLIRLDSPWLTPPTPGDANGDGHVDGVDYIIWATNYGDDPASDPPGAPGNGDFNNDGTVDGVDYITWASNYGQGPNDGVAVPEPGSLFLAMLACAGALLCRFRGAGRDWRRTHPHRRCTN